MIQWILERK